MPAAAIATIASAAIGGAATVAASRSSNNASRSVANAQLAASNSADQIQREANERAFQLEQEQQAYDRWLTSATAAARKPYMDAIAGAIGDGGASFSPDEYHPGTYAAATPFQAPDPAQVKNDPAFQFRLKEGQNAIERSAAARGTIKTSGTLKDVLNYGEEAASQEYDKIYGRSRDEYALNEGLRASAFDRNEAAKLNATNVRNQGGYQAASLAQNSAGNRLSSLLALAGLASPGEYPGASATGSGGLYTPPGYAVAEAPMKFGQVVLPTDEPPRRDRNLIDMEQDEMGTWGTQRSIYGSAL